jgi:hypothetical protein
MGVIVIAEALCTSRFLGHHACAYPDSCRTKSNAAPVKTLFLCGGVAETIAHKIGINALELGRVVGLAR